MNEVYVNLLGRFGFKCVWEVPNTMTCLDILQVNKDSNLCDLVRNSKLKVKLLSIQEWMLSAHD